MQDRIQRRGIERRKIAVALAIAAGAAGSVAFGQHGGAGSAPAMAEPMQTAGVAFNGLDLVSLFGQGGLVPTPGLAEFTHTHEGLTYRFATEANRDLFIAEPERFLPMFAGHAADELANGLRTPADGTIYSIHNNRLFFFSTVEGRDAWLVDFESLLITADEKWQELASDAGEPVDLSLFRHRAEKYELDRNKLAIEGYDPVAYFPEGGGKPVKGSKDFEINYRGITYRFVSQANRERFATNPSRYEPAFGGWCAYAAAKDQYTEPDVKHFEIRNERLYLFYKGIGGDTLKFWRKEGPEKLEPKADAWWSKESGEQARK